MPTEVDDPIGVVDQPVVVGGDHHDAARRCQPPKCVAHHDHLFVVEVRGRLVGEHHGRIGSEGTGDGDALLLPTRHSTRSMVEPMGQAELGEELGGALFGGRRRMPPITNGAATFSTAVRLASRLNAWNTTPTRERRCSTSWRGDSAVTSTPSTTIEPDVGVSSPAMAESNVLLPQPLGPRSRTSSPSPMVTSRPSMGRTC